MIFFEEKIILKKVALLPGIAHCALFSPFCHQVKNMTKQYKIHVEPFHMEMFNLDTGVFSVPTILRKWTDDPHPRLPSFPANC